MGPELVHEQRRVRIHEMRRPREVEERRRARDETVDVGVNLDTASLESFDGVVRVQRRHHLAAVARLRRVAHRYIERGGEW